jgi:hypothetical protein
MTNADVRAVEALNFGLCILAGLTYVALWIAPFFH